MKTMAILALAAAALWPTDQARAEPVPADPVARCAGVLRAIPILLYGATTAERIEPVGSRGCRLTGVTGTTGSISIAQITADRLDFERIYNGQLPDAITLDMQDVVIRTRDGFSILGTFDVSADYDLDVRTKVFTLKELTLRGSSIGEVSLSGEIEGYSLPHHGGFWPDDADQETIRLRRVRLHAIDGGFLSTAIFGLSGPGGPAAIDDVKREITANLATWPEFGVPGPAVAAMTAFVGDLPSPRRPITISATPSTPVPVSRLDPSDPGLRQAMERLNLVVTY
ncbi:hypothetical protein [Inquilinus sp.]|jgi:hypothetical protein|uniref:hypothetical protein n=1 Tax=Inquilinus sp. TaxID=1932117 RepID=UPI003784594A